MSLPAGAAVPFTKMAGGGNDFVMIDNRGGAVSDPRALARVICTRRLSVGADGLILIEEAPAATFRMLYFNSDGSRADFCANGTRCAARFAQRIGLAASTMTIETDAGLVNAEVDGSGRVTLALGSPSGFVREKPLALPDGRRVSGSFVRVGVPHYVLYPRGAEFWEMEIDATGRAIREHAELRPDGANVNFVAVDDAHSISVRTYERGVEGETLSCGSGVVSSVIVSAFLGRVQSPVNVLTRSGIVLRVEFEGEGEGVSGVRLSGDARVIYESAIGPETLTGFDADWVRNPTQRVGQP